MQLAINGVTVAASEASGSAPRPDRGVWPERLERSYDGPASLSFVSDRGQVFAPDSIVRLSIAGQTAFEGLLEPIQIEHSAAAGGRRRYTAFDRSRAMGNPIARWTTGDVQFPVSYGSLGGVIGAYLAAQAGELGRVGLAASATFLAGADGVPVLPVQLSGVTIHAGLEALARSAPGVRIVVSAAGNRYEAHAVHGTKPYALDLQRYRVEQVSIEQSLEGCAGAVRTARRQFSLPTTQYFLLALNPAWNAALEATWSADKAGQVDATTGQPAAIGDVFRLFTWSGAVPAGAQVFVDQDMGGASAALTQWRPVEVEAIDVEQRLVRTREPIIAALRPEKAVRYNQHIPGAAKAGAARLRYSLSGTGTYQTTGVRYPASGFSGGAYALAPKLCGYEQLVEIPSLPAGSINEAAYARAVFDVVSQPVVRGAVTLIGDLPIDLIGLGRRISFIDSGGRATGFERLVAPLMGIAYSFGDQRCELQFSTQRTVAGQAA